MQNYLLALLIVTLAPIIIEDFRHRKISVLWIFGVITIAIIQQWHTKLSLSDIASNTLINVGIIALNYCILTLYFSVRNKRVIDIKKEYLGLGDVAFLLAVAFLFSPVNFMCFLLLSLIFTLLFTLFTKLLSLKRFTTIPLAGLQAFFLLFTLLFIFLKDNNWEPNNDQFTISVILNYAGIS